MDLKQVFWYLQVDKSMKTNVWQEGKNTNPKTCQQLYTDKITCTDLIIFQTNAVWISGQIKF